MSDDILLKVDEQPWIPMIEGIDFRLLRISEETGTWTVILRCQKGSGFPSHKHYAAGEYYVIKGAMEYRAGRAITGDYGYEPVGVIHDGTVFTEYTELLFTNHGAVVFLDDDGGLMQALDYEAILDLVKQSESA